MSNESKKYWYNNIFNMLSNYLVNKKLSGTVLPRHKEVVDFFKKRFQLLIWAKGLKTFVFDILK